MPKAWIEIDEQYTVYDITFGKESPSTAAIETEITLKQAKLVLEYKRISKQYEDMCRQLINS